jgi:hypothetical protein
LQVDADNVHICSWCFSCSAATSFVFVGLQWTVSII